MTEPTVATGYSITGNDCAGLTVSSNATTTCTITNAFVAPTSTPSSTVPAIVIAPGSLPDATVGSAYSETIGASNGNASDTFAWTIATDTLSSDFTVATSTAGVTITGTPTGTGFYELAVVAASNAYSNSSTEDYTFTVDAAPVASGGPSTSLGAGGGGGGGGYYNPTYTGDDSNGVVLGASTTNPSALLATLESELVTLEQQLIAQQFKGAAACSFTFNQNLSKGMTSNGVLHLQKVLNVSAITQIAQTGAGSPGNESTYFGSTTKDAVVIFQNIFANDILTSAGLTSGNGYVGAATRAKLNSLCAGQ